MFLSANIKYFVSTAKNAKSAKKILENAEKKNMTFINHNNIIKNQNIYKQNIYKIRIYIKSEYI